VENLEDLLLKNLIAFKPMLAFACYSIEKIVPALFKKIIAECMEQGFRCPKLPSDINARMEGIEKPTESQQAI
jgi:hypothetical protein